MAPDTPIKVERWPIGRFIEYARNPRFVEDIVRLAAEQLAIYPAGFFVRSQNAESIHEHDAIGLVLHRFPRADAHLIANAIAY